MHCSRRFQSTLPQRERPHLPAYNRLSILFQSTLPQRERLYPYDCNPGGSGISIHAPAKGATPLGRYRNVPCPLSPPAPATGATVPVMYSNLSMTVFQSTLPQRERLQTSIRFDIIPIFQSTLPQRERRLWIHGIVMRIKFQSTLPQRERLSFLLLLSYIFAISIHAPAKGATSCRMTLCIQ